MPEKMSDQLHNRIAAAEALIQALQARGLPTDMANVTLDRLLAERDTEAAQHVVALSQPKAAA
jgi:hypothetical protein